MGINMETTGFLSSPVNNTDLPNGIFEKVMYQNEEILFVQKKPKDPQYYFMFLLGFVVISEFIGLMVYGIVSVSSMWFFWVTSFVPITLGVLILFWYLFGHEYSILTNFRVISLKRARFRKSVTITSIPLLAITETKCPNPTTLEFWCGTRVGKRVPKVEFKELSESEVNKIKEIVEVGKTKKSTLSSMPLTIFGHPNLSSLKPSYKALADKYTPFLWAHKPTVWQFVKPITISSIIVLVWVTLILTLIAKSAFTLFVGLMATITIESFFFMLFFLAFMKSLDGFNAISEKHGILLIRTGFSVSDTVIPWSEAYPLTSIIDLKDESGTLSFYSKPLMLIKGPESLVREEIIFHKFVEGKSETA